MNAQQWEELASSLHDAEDYDVINNKQCYVIVLSNDILENLIELATYMHSITTIEESIKKTERHFGGE